MFLLASKIFAVILGFIVLAKSYVDFRSRIESLQVFLFWTLTWATIIILAVFPSIIDEILELAGGPGVGLGTFFGMAIVFLFFIVYRIYVKLELVEQKLIRTIQELALRDDWQNKHPEPRS
jgi:hypothetical protein